MLPALLMRAEISYDLVMENDMHFVEGTYRLPGQDWQVVIFSRRPVASPEFKPTTWESGVAGVCVRFPKGWPLNKSVVERLLGEHLGVTEWVEVRGPDSMNLR